MRCIMLLLAVASLSACGSRSDQSHPPAAKPLTFDGATGDQKAILAHGERLSHVLGCRGCHTETLKGHWFNDDAPELGKLYASNLTRVIPTMSDAQLTALLRTGKHPTRGDLWIMPSEIFQRLSEADMTALIAHLRTIKPSGAPTPPPTFTDKATAMIAKGELKPVAAYLAEYRSKLPFDVGGQHALGRYIAGATCAECNGPDLKGLADFGPGISTPDLDIAGSYTDAQLTTLLTIGKGKASPILG